MKKCFIRVLTVVFTVMVFPVTTEAQEVSLRVANPTCLQRQEVIEADLSAICQMLGVDSDTSLVVKNALGQEMTYQKSYDGKLLLSVAMQPKGELVYTIVRGKPSAFKLCVFGRVYPERIDDLTWENDRGIYRIYGPALQKKGERSFGTDVWVKNTPDLVAEERYRLHMLGWHKGDSLKKAGKPEDGNRLFLDTSFHLDHGYGMDVYSVGASLGCGAPALMKDGGLVFPYCFKECKIRDNGPLRFTAELIYGTTAEGITEHRLISLDKGSHFNKITVWYDGITNPTPLATGVVLHEDDLPTSDSLLLKGRKDMVLGKDYVLYADPTDNPNVHQSQIFVGTLFPNGVDETVLLKGAANHGIGILHSYKGEPYTYYFGSAWSLYDVPTMAHWKLLADEYLIRLRQRPTVQIHPVVFVSPGNE
jgi:hypothetical protein